MQRTILSCTIFFFSFQSGFSQLTQNSDSLFGINNIVTETSEPASPSTLPDIKYHLTARSWKPLNISKDDYLDRVEGIVRQFVKFQNFSGAIIDPYANIEIQYSTPYFANAVGTLISVGRATDLLDEGVAAMNKATADIAAGTSPTPGYGEFYLAPLASAIPLYTPYVSASQLQTWKSRMSKPVADIILGLTHNWRTYAMKGEWDRAKNGYVNKDTAVSWLEKSWINTQKNRLNNNQWNFYHDSSSNPDSWAYESLSRSNLLAMIAEGYDGVSRDEILNILKKGTQSSLLLQDPSGQVAAGGRSGNHTWNDIVLANGYETMAEIEYNEGDMQLASQYRHAAALAFKSAQRWIRSDGTYSVTKNLFNPKSRIGYADYSFFINYNGNMMFHMAENYLRHKATISEQPAPNEIGGYTIVSDKTFATAVANAGGMYMEACLRGSTEVTRHRYWTALGVVRFARPGWDSRLGPSDGVRSISNKLGVSFAPAFLENGNWTCLASMPERYEAFFTTQFTHPLLVRCRIEYKPKRGKTGPTFINDFVITPDGILSTLTSTADNYGIISPVLTFDGATHLSTSLASNIASTSFPGEADQQNFIPLDSSATITVTDSLIRSSYGDLQPVRMVSGTDSNETFIYPRDSTDPSAESVKKSYTRLGNGFSTVLGRVFENTYIGRTSAGGVGTSIDINNDSIADVTFNISTGFLMQLKMGEITKIETDSDVTAIIQGQTLSLKAYIPVAINNPLKLNISNVIASSDNGNVAANTIDKDYNTRWSANGDKQWIRFYLGTTALIKTVKIAWHRGDERQESFDIQTSFDSTTWTTVFSGHSGGKTTAFETYDVSTSPARYVRIVGHGNDLNNWIAITEVEILKDSNKPAIVNITNPANGTSYTAPATIVLNADAIDRDGTIKMVDFYNGSTLIFTENIPPYSRPWINVSEGNYSITAKATDNSGNVTISDVVNISVVHNMAPVVKITSPDNNAGYIAPATIQLTADAIDVDGTIKTVDFYNGDSLIFTENLFPYSKTWLNVPEGNYFITAKATDNNGKTTTSTPVAIFVEAASISLARGSNVDISNWPLCLNVNPNPATDILNISAYGLQTNNQSTISAVSVSGVVAKTIQTNSLNKNVQLDISSLSAGVYFIKVINGDTVLYRQFVKL